MPFRETGHLLRLSDDREPSMRFMPQTPARDGGGKHLSRIRREVQLRPGFWMSVMDCRPRQPISICYRRQAPIINIGVILSGCVTNTINRGDHKPVCINNTSGTSGLLFLPEPDGVISIPPQEQVKALHLHMDAPCFARLLKNDRLRLPSPLLSSLENRETGKAPAGHLVLKHALPPDIECAACQILHHRRPGLPAALYLEAKAIEILSLVLAGFAEEKRTRPAATSAGPGFRNKIQAAAQYLVSDLASPPSLRQVAAHVHLNINKLEAGFHTVFNTSVFAYLRQYRMEKARLLFQRTDLNVSETAWAVGYVNVSHFSQAFKQAFGVLPKAYRRQIKTSFTD